MKRTIITFLCISFALYLTFGYLWQCYNPNEWKEADRALFVFLIWITVCLSPLINLMIKDLEP